MVDLVRRLIKVMQLRAPAAPLALLLVLATSISANAADVGNTAADFKIEPSQLADALSQLGAQSGVQVVYSPEIAQGLKAKGVSGHLTVDAALKQLLAGTGITWSYVNGDTVVLKRVGAKKAPLSKAATPPPPGSEELQEIIVSAQKREERLQDVPMSIAAIGAEELESRRITSLDDLSFAVPGLSMDSTGSFQRRIEIRGISNVIAGSSSLVGMYVDEADVTVSPAYQLDLGVYDLERVEVLRGPQGTLYGAGSAGGTVRFITNSPQLDRFRMNGDFATTFSPDGAPGEQVTAMVNAPIIPDQLGLRVSGMVDQGGGWIDVPAANLKNYNANNLIDLRTEGRWQPSQQFTVNATTIIHRDNTPPNLGENPPGTLTPNFGGTIAPSATADYEVYNLTMDYDFGAFRILNSASAVEQKKNTSYLPDFVQFSAPPAPPLYFNEFNSSSDSSFNDELRLSSLGAGRWQWTVGAYYKRERSIADSQGQFALGAAPIDFGLTDLTSKSFSLFGDTSYRLADRLTVGAGVRGFHEDQDYVSGPPPLSTQTGSFHSVDPRFYVSYELNDVVNLYTSAAKGFRSGGFNSQGQPKYDPEDIWTYELGMKVATAGQRLYADLALFDTNYSNYQVKGFYTGASRGSMLVLNITGNGGSARLKGVEWSVTSHPEDSWTLSLSGNYIDSRFTEVPAIGSNYNVGDPLDFVPEYTVTASVQRNLQIYGRPSFVRLDYEQQGRETYRLRTIGSWYFAESSVIDLLNFNSSIELNKNLKFGFFAQNLLNTRGFTNGAYIENGAPRPRPRTFGVDFAMNFE